MKSRKKPIHPYLVVVGRHIKYLRTLKKMSLETLGSSIGIDAANLQKIENGANITMSSLIKILIVLETNPVNFFSDLKWNLHEDDIEELTIPRPIIKKALKKRAKN